MDILEECRMMLELAISCLQRTGHDTEQFERTVAKISRQEQVKNCSTPNVEVRSGQLVCPNCYSKNIKKFDNHNDCQNCGWVW